MHLMYNKSGGNLYASVGTSKRIDGKVVKGDIIYLGRVIDKEKGIYESRERGIFTYDIKSNEFGVAELSEVPKKKRGKMITVTDFGDAFILNEFMRDMGIAEVIDKCGSPNIDTMKALVMFYILTDEPHSYAETWYQGSYASILFPDADLDGRRISEFLKRIGGGEVGRRFFKEYIPLICKDGNDAFIIDSTGVPNSVHMDVTAVSNHNGQISNEVRLVLICRVSDRMPIYYRYIPGNVIDSSTLMRTVDELQCMGIDTKYILMDAGYCTLENMSDLIDSNIDFITRLKPNYNLYKDMVADNLDKLTENNRVLHKNRFMRIYSEKRKLDEDGRLVWVHIILDEETKNTQDKNTYMKFMEGSIKMEERDGRYSTNGTFILVSSFAMDPDEVIDSYFERCGIEQLIDVGKTNSRLGEAAVHSVDTMIGKWLIEFIAMSVNQSMINRFKEKKTNMRSKKRKNKNDIPGRDMSVSLALYTLRNQKCDIFENTVLPREPTSLVNNAYGLFGYESPNRIDR